MKKNYNSIEMKLIILILGIPIALANMETYRGYGYCDSDGWTCGTDEHGKKISYDCDSESGRVWVWTARLDPDVSVFQVQNCHTLQVHIDCTRGSRATLLRHFKVVNITYLEFLRPTTPGSYLHDNSEIPHVPPNLYMKNVSTVKLFPGMFEKPEGLCRNQFATISNLTLVDVNLHNIQKNQFRLKNLNNLYFENVVITEMESYAMSVAGDVSITRSTFPNLPNNAIQLVAKKVVTISNNTFKKIEFNGITIRSNIFTFKHNHVDEIRSQGLDVMSSNIDISGNELIHLETGALENIVFSYTPGDFQIASRFLYKFSNNTLKNINPASFHTFWNFNKNVCADTVFKGNKFECSCINFGWTSMPQGMGAKIFQIMEFYDLYLKTTENFCSNYENCTIKSIVENIQDICMNTKTISSVCESAKNKTETIEKQNSNSKNTSTNDSKELSIEPTINETTPVIMTKQLNNPTEQNYWLQVTQRIVPLTSYSDNNFQHEEKSSVPIWFIIVPILLIIVGVSVGLFIWWSKRKRQRQLVRTVYTNRNGCEADNLMIINDNTAQQFYK